MRKTLLSILFCAFVAVSISAQTTAFTFQGSMKDGTNPANGSYDFEFKLFDAFNGGAQQGSTIQPLNVTVANGIFTVSLDFGVSVLTGADRFLDIAVRNVGGGAFTALTPRQRVNSAPYAVKSLTSNSLASASGIPAGSGNYIQNTTSPQALSNFSISGTGKALIIDANQYNINGSQLIKIGGAVFGNLSVGINTGNPTSAGEGNSFFGRGAGLGNTTGGSNTFLGSGAGAANAGGGSNTFVGIGAGNTNAGGSNNTVVGGFADVGSGNLSYASAIGAGAVVTTSDTLVLGRSDDIVRVPGFIRVVQLGGAGPTPLCHNANFTISTCSSSLRYKTNFGSFASGLALINRLKPITFDWKDGGMKDVGFGAEDIEKIDPRFVTYNDKGEVEGVKYDRLSVAFVNAVKEQQAQIEVQAKEIKDQKSLLTAQQAQIDALMALVCAQNTAAAICTPKK